VVHEDEAIVVQQSPHVPGESTVPHVHGSIDPERRVTVGVEIRPCFRTLRSETRMRSGGFDDVAPPGADGNVSDEHRIIHPFGAVEMKS
jgi:hypothetical protein